MWVMAQVAAVEALQQNNFEGNQVDKIIPGVRLSKLVVYSRGDGGPHLKATLLLRLKAIGMQQLLRALKKLLGDGLRVLFEAQDGGLQLLEETEQIAVFDGIKGRVTEVTSAHAVISNGNTSTSDGFSERQTKSFRMAAAEEHQ